MPDEPLKPPKARPYDPVKLSYKEWVALPDDEREEVLQELFRLEDAKVPRPLARGLMNQNSGGIMRLLRKVLAEEKRAGVRINGWIVLGEGQTLHRRLLLRDDEISSDS